MAFFSWRQNCLLFSYVFRTEFDKNKTKFLPQEYFSNYTSECASDGIFLFSIHLTLMFSFILFIYFFNTNIWVEFIYTALCLRGRAGIQYIQYIHFGKYWNKQSRKRLNVKMDNNFQCLILPFLTNKDCKNDIIF